jgi:hypothetical protein
VPVAQLCGKVLEWLEEDEENAEGCELEADHDGLHFDGYFYYNDDETVIFHLSVGCQDRNFHPVQRRHRSNHICKYH